MFLRRAAVVVGSGAAGFTLGHPIHPDTPLSAPPPPRQPQSRRTVHLASSVWTPGIPTTVLIHGLDSSRETWRGTLGFCQANGLPAVALDLRGHGESPLGDPAEFNIDALVADVERVAASTGPGRVVVVGHSMGGRVAMSYAAAHPDRVAALVIEDMDIIPRQYDWNATPPVESFSRKVGHTPGRSAIDAMGTNLHNVGGYDPKRVEAWKGGRIRSTPDDGAWSDINPHARDLARRHVLATRDGETALAKLGNLASKGLHSFPIHLLVAGKGSACKDPDAMRVLTPDLRVHRFLESGHSIHNEAAPEFRTLLKDVVFESALREGYNANDKTGQPT